MRERASRWIAAAALALIAVVPFLQAPLAAEPEAAAKKTEAAAAPTAEQIVERYIAARGGLSKIRGIQSLRQKAYVNAGGGREGVAVREIKRPGKIRFELTVQGRTAAYIVNGNTGWGVNPFEEDLTPKPLPEDVLADAAEQADIEGPLVDWKKKGHNLELAGKETIDGRDVYKLIMALKSGGSRVEYIDAKTYHQVRSDATRKTRSGTVTTETRFSDFKKTGGILFPRKVEVQAQGRPNKLRLVVNEVEVNPKIPDARFALLETAPAKK